MVSGCLCATVCERETGDGMQRRSSQEDKERAQLLGHSTNTHSLRHSATNVTNPGTTQCVAENCIVVWAAFAAVNALVRRPASSMLPAFSSGGISPTLVLFCTKFENSAAQACPGGEKKNCEQLELHNTSHLFRVSHSREGKD